MKAYVEVLKLETQDIISTSPIPILCPEDTAGTTTPCAGDDDC